MFETLEARRLFTISTPIPGIVYVYGTGAGDNITVSGSGHDISISGSAGSRTLTDVKLLFIFGGGGNDTIAIDDAVLITSQISGDGGNDTITGGGGNDGINGGDGNDVIHGGSGNDQITGGNGNDQLWGDGGADVINAVDRGSDTIHKDSFDYVLSDKHDIIV